MGHLEEAFCVQRGHGSPGTGLVLAGAEAGRYHTWCIPLTLGVLLHLLMAVPRLLGSSPATEQEP